MNNTEITITRKNYMARAAECQKRIDSLVSAKFIMERKISDIDADISEEYSKMFK